MKKRRILLAAFAVLSIILLMFSLSGCDSRVLDEAAQVLLDEWNSQQQATSVSSGETPSPSSSLLSPTEDADQPVYKEAYSSHGEVAAYLHVYGELPVNYITKEKAKQSGWNASEGNLWDVLPGACIGGDYFGNYEGALPSSPGRTWHECDVDYEGGYRGSSRLLYSTDGLIYYTNDHYASFQQLY